MILEAFTLFSRGDTLFDLISSRHEIYFDLGTATAEAGDLAVWQVILSIPEGSRFGVAPPGHPASHLRQFDTLPEALDAATGYGLQTGQAIKVIRYEGPMANTASPVRTFITAWAPLCDGERRLSVSNPFYKESRAGH